MNKLLLKHIQILKLVLLVHKVMLQSSNGPFHIKYTFLLTMEPHRRNSHKMTHYSLCSDDTQLLIPLSTSLQHHGHLLLIPLYQFIVLLLGKLQTSNLVVQDANIPKKALLRVVLSHTGLVA